MTPIVQGQRCANTLPHDRQSGRLTMTKDYLLGNSNNIAPSAVYVKKTAGEYVKIWDQTDDLTTPPIDVDYEIVDVQEGAVKNLPHK